MVESHPRLDRWFRYRHPKKYWQNRGGETYFQEQEIVLERTLRSYFIAEDIKKLPIHSLLEIGCGYGKQLKNLVSGGLFLTGCDFSFPQLLKAKEFCPELSSFLVEADAECLPFRDRSFDAVLSSAVILHNPFKKAQKIISEILRVSRKYVIHNEDTNITFSRYGYDLRKTYKKMRLDLTTSKPIPCVSDPSITQFTIVELPEGGVYLKPHEILLQHYRGKKMRAITFLH